MGLLHKKKKEKIPGIRTTTHFKKKKTVSSMLTVLKEHMDRKLKKIRNTAYEKKMRTLTMR